MKFEKMHANGNDFIIIESSELKQPMNEEMAKKWCHPHFGIGADGVLVIAPYEKDYFVTIFNADGSEASMCGNGLRCVADYLKRHEKTPNVLWTRSGAHAIHFIDNTITVEIGKPEKNFLFPNSIGSIRYTLVYLGNHHTIGLVEDLEKVDIEEIATAIRRQLDVTVSLVQVLSKNQFRQQIYERGVGQTLSCGSAAAAALFALHLGGHCDTQATALQPGGPIEVAINPQGIVTIQGPVELVYVGDIQ